MANKHSTMTRTALKAAVANMEQTRLQIGAHTALREWRIRMAQTHVRPGKKGSGK